MDQAAAQRILYKPSPYPRWVSLQALWMGVPVIALRGGNFVGRMGASFLSTLGEPGWIADDEEGYRTIARRLAAELPALRQGRAALRRRMAESGLSDLDRYTAHVQALLRRVWRANCSGGGVRLLAAEALCEATP